MHVVTSEGKHEEQEAIQLRQDEFATTNPILQVVHVLLVGLQARQFRGHELQLPVLLL